ncbi:hypothetical protein VWN94_10145, partial [Campylobacter coli]|nr:hypothetical protein [Campylobacter coli]
NYSTTLDKLNPDDFLNALKEYEHLHLILSKIMTYAYLCFAKDIIKPQMIEEATLNARNAAIKFAQDSNSHLGKIKKASQGQFSIS